MKTIKFNNKEYNIPEQWSEVTVGMLIYANELSEILYDAPSIAVLSAYTGIPIRDLRLSNVGEVNKVLELMNFITTPYVPKPSNSFTLDGIEYSCEADLVDQHFEDWVSIQTTLNNYKDEPYKALPRLLAALCKKDGETLDDFNLDERSKLFMKLPMTDAKDVEGFFLHVQNAYKVLTLLSSTTNIQGELVLAKVQELQDTMKKRKGESGIFSGMRLQIGILQIYLWWVKKQLVKYFNSEHSKPSKSNWKQTFKTWLTKRVKRKKVSN
jgi:hypothetical protein